MHGKYHPLYLSETFLGSKLSRRGVVQKCRVGQAGKRVICEFHPFSPAVTGQDQGTDSCFFPVHIFFFPPGCSSYNRIRYNIEFALPCPRSSPWVSFLLFLLHSPSSVSSRIRAFFSLVFLSTLAPSMTSNCLLGALLSG